mmetsp:Transcript_32809/g.83842  ORF Transcript_32809/g.83842 Transcript_32809/m.83842 type:complete len:218 (+) Transcript_32809:156-809(+)
MREFSFLDAGAATGPIPLPAPSVCSSLLAVHLLEAQIRWPEHRPALRHKRQPLRPAPAARLERAGVADDEQAAARARNGHVEPARVGHKADAPRLVGPHGGEHHHVCLLPLEAVHRGYPDLVRHGAAQRLEQRLEQPGLAVVRGEDGHRAHVLVVAEDQVGHRHRQARLLCVAEGPPAAAVPKAVARLPPLDGNHAHWVLACPRDSPQRRALVRGDA